MRKRKILGATAAFTLVLSGFVGVPPATAAGGAIEAHYRVVSSIERSDGAYDVTFDFTLTNTGALDYGDLELTLLGSGTAVCLGPADPIPFGQLIAGETTTTTWTLTFVAPVEGHPDLGFAGYAWESDETGDPVFVQIGEQGESP